MALASHHLRRHGVHRANVGYVHAIAHQFGGRYHTPHGLANAIMLPHVLRFSAPSIQPHGPAGGARQTGHRRDDDEACWPTASSTPWSSSTAT